MAAGERDKGGLDPKNSTLLIARNAPLLAAGAVVFLYGALLFHFAVNAPVSDEWHNIQLVNLATHGHLSFQLFWVQYFESRMFFPNLIFVAVGAWDHYDVRTVIGLSALSYIASFFILLTAVRRYLDRRLDLIPTLVFSLVWFSLSAVSDALWAFELGYYLVVLALVCLLFFLLVARLPRWLCVGLAIAATIVGSCSFLQGLLLWPVGLLILLWNRPTRRTLVESGLWIVAAGITIGLYFWRFDLAGTSGWCTSHCSASYDISHPTSFATYWFRLVGNVVPAVSGTTGPFTIFLGVIFTGAAALIIIQSLRERKEAQRLPLPLALVVFAVLWDLTITAGRLSADAPGFHEYTLPQVILMSGVVIYAWSHLPDHLFAPSDSNRGPIGISAIACLALCVLLAVQILGSASYGLNEARSVSAAARNTARLAVNLATIPKDQQDCYEDVILEDGLVPVSELGPARQVMILARDDQLSMFSPDAINGFRAEGRPHLPLCAYVAAHHGKLSSTTRP